MKTPEEIVQENLEFYNHRDITGFMGCFSTQAELFNLGETAASLSGIDELREFYSTLFDNSPSLNSNILKRITIGNKVIDHESITGRNGSDIAVELVLIYQVSDQKIERITVIRP